MSDPENRDQVSLDKQIINQQAKTIEFMRSHQSTTEKMMLVYRKEVVTMNTVLGRKNRRVKRLMARVLELNRAMDELRERILNGQSDEVLVAIIDSMDRRKKRPTPEGATA